MSAAWEIVGAGVTAIDTALIRPRLDASHLVVDGGHAAFIDVGTSLSAPHLMQALADADVDPESVEYVFLTHIHLDHAGGAGAMALRLPRAQVVVHPRAATHMVEPARLIAATIDVYGESHFRQNYGEIVPVPAERIRTVEDGERIALGARTFEFLHTPGHALHHVALFDRDARELFSGDTFGISYREFDTAAGEFVFVTTSPTQFDPLQLHASVDRILALAPEAVYMTHYSRVADIARLGADMHADIDASVRIARAAAATDEPAAEIRAQLFARLSQRLDAHGCALDEVRRHELLDGDLVLNADGLVAWLARSAAG